MAVSDSLSVGANPPRPSVHPDLRQTRLFARSRMFTCLCDCCSKESAERPAGRLGVRTSSQSEVSPRSVWQLSLGTLAVLAPLTTGHGPSLLRAVTLPPQPAAASPRSLSPWSSVDDVRMLWATARHGTVQPVPRRTATPRCRHSFCPPKTTCFVSSLFCILVIYSAVALSDADI